MPLKLATSQFPVSADIEANKQQILQQMRAAAEQNCDVIHFPEGSLSGYAGVDFASFHDYNWPLLRACTEEIMLQAGSLDIWVIMGSAHPLTAPNKPHNSVYIIDNQGNIVDRYDKLFCAGDDSGRVGDLAHYSSGSHFAVFKINGITCGVQICHDYRYPELYRELKTRGVELVFHSYHAGNMTPTRQALMEAQIDAAFQAFNPGKTYPELTMPATMISYAANNYVWISCSNTSAPESCWASFIVRPDGVIVGRLEKNVPGLLITDIDPGQLYYDSTLFWRNRAMDGIYYSGEAIADERSEQRNAL